MDHSKKKQVVEEFSSDNLFSIVWRRKWLVILSILLSMAVSVLVTVSTQSTYRANATIQIEPKAIEMGYLAGGKNLNNGMNGDSHTFFRTRYETLKSRKILLQVIAETNLQHSLLGTDDKPSVIDHLQTKIKESLGFSAEKNTGSLSVDLYALFLQRLSIRPIPKTHLVEIYYEGRSPQEAKDVVASLVENFITSQRDSQTETGQFDKDLLDKQVNEARQRLNLSERKLVRYSNEKGILGIDEKQTRHVTKLNQLNAALVQAEIELSVAESKYQQGRDNTRMSSVLNNPVIVNLKAHLLGLEGQYQDKLKIFKPSYPDMQRLSQQINAARRKLVNETNLVEKATLSNLKITYLAAKSQQRRLHNELARFNKKLQSLQNSGIDYNRLKREVESNTYLYKNLLQRLSGLAVAPRTNATSIKVIDPAVVPLTSYSPKPWFNMIMSLISGLFLGFGWVFVREISDQSVRSTEDLQRMTGLPVLGLIPKPKKVKAKDMAMATVLNPNTPFAEAYRILSANVRFTVVRQSGKVLLVTSCSPNEGKTTTVCNMACAYAQMGMKVLLIDADLRKPAVAEKLKIPNRQGLSNYLGDNEDLSNVTQQIKSVNGLFVIPSGSYSDDIIGLISQQKMQFLLSQAEEKFDFIIIDSPPVGGFADTLLLSSLVSSTLIVADETKLKIAKIRYSIEQLNRIKNTAVGFLLFNSTNPLVIDSRYEKHYRQRRSFSFSKALSHVAPKRLLLNDKTVGMKRIKVRGVKKPFWGKVKKGINLGYMN